MAHFPTFLVLLLLAYPAFTQGQCPAGSRVSFELVTGAIFMNDKGRLSQFQTFDLLECIKACRSTPACSSANFETGLCTLSQFNATAMPDSLRTDDFPVFPNYIQKLCLREMPATCQRDWAFQRTVNYYLESHDTKTIAVRSKEECLEACLKEDAFKCYSAEMRYHNRTCVLSSTSQSILQQRLQKAPEGTSIDYFENNCQIEPRSYCEYNRIRGRVLKASDVVRSKVISLDECKALCLNASFNCNYYHYGQLSDDECSLSHHSAITLSHISEPYVFSADFISYELRACFSIQLSCEAKKMTASIQMDRLFDGLVYAKEQPKTCLTEVNNSSEFELVMPLDGTFCNTVNNVKGLYSNYIMVQYNKKIVTSKDIGLSISCEYDLGSRNVTGTMTTNGAPTITENVNYKVPSPIVQMTIRDSSGNPLISATVGDKIYIQFDLATSNAPDIYNIFVKDLVAVEAQGKTRIKMIDSNGCPADDIVLGPVESLNDGRTLRLPIEAFKFSSNDEVEFTALIKPCQKQCDPAQCIDDATQIVYSSFGKRRRRRRDLEEVSDSYDVMVVSSTSSSARQHADTDDVLVHHRINVNDVFSACANSVSREECLRQQQSAMSSLAHQAMQQTTAGNAVRSVDLSGIVCIHKLAIAVAASLVLLIQLVFAVVLAFICQRYRGQRQPRFKASLDISKPTLSINTSYASQETAASSSSSSSASAFDISQPSSSAVSSGTYAVPQALSKTNSTTNAIEPHYSTTTAFQDFNKAASTNNKT